VGIKWVQLLTFDSVRQIAGQGFALKDHVTSSPLYTAKTLINKTILPKQRFFIYNIETDGYRDGKKSSSQTASIQCICSYFLFDIC